MITMAEAQRYINYGIKEGYFNEEDFDGLGDIELLKKVQDLMNKGDAYADYRRKDE